MPQSPSSLIQRQTHAFGSSSSLASLQPTHTVNQPYSYASLEDS